MYVGGGLFGILWMSAILVGYDYDPVAAGRLVGYFVLLLSLGVGIYGFFRHRRPAERRQPTDGAESTPQPGVTAACPNCGRVNSVHTLVCPRCERHLD